MWMLIPVCLHTPGNFQERIHVYSTYMCVYTRADIHTLITKFPGKHLNLQYVCYVLW